MGAAEVCVEILLCIFLPPLAIYFHTKQCDVNIVISIILCILFWFPAMLFAAYICFFRS